MDNVEARELMITSSPHIRAGTSTSGIMGKVLIALLPCLTAGVFFFGFRSLWVCLVSTASAVATEFIVCKTFRHHGNVTDMSAALTGLLLGLTLPAAIPLWQAFFGGVMATGVFKGALGGLGKNPVNPAIASRVVMLLSFGEMATPSYPVRLDTVTSATPLSFLKEADSFGIGELFFGLRGGCIGETCILAILIGFIFLSVTGVVSYHSTLAYVLTVLFVSLFFENGDVLLAVEWCLAGSVIFSAVFMVTDYVSSPATHTGQVIYGILCGALTCFIRFYGNYPEGVSFAVLLGNFAVPMIDRLSRKRVLGVKKS